MRKALLFLPLLSCRQCVSLWRRRARVEFEVSCVTLSMLEVAQEIQKKAARMAMRRFLSREVMDCARRFVWQWRFSASCFVGEFRSPSMVAHRTSKARLASPLCSPMLSPSAANA